MYRFSNKWYPSLLFIGLGSSIVINCFVEILDLDLRSFFQMVLNFSTVGCLILNKKASLKIGIRIWALFSLLTGFISLLSVALQMIIKRYSLESNYLNLLSHTFIFVMGGLLLYFLNYSVEKIKD